MRLALTACLLLVLFADALAEQLPVKRYSVADGLAHDEIRSIFRDSHGFLWFSTLAGLSRFDGYRFTTYTPKDGLPFSFINRMIETRGGVYWVAVNGGGVSRYDPSATQRGSAGGVDGAGNRAIALFTTYRMGEEPNANNVNTVYEDHAGNIWAGTDAGLFRLAKGDVRGRFERVVLGLRARSDEALEVEAIVEDAEGSLWVGTAWGLARLAPDGRVFHYRLDSSQSVDYVWTLMKDKDGRIWTGHQSGLLVFVPTSLPPVGSDDDGFSAALVKKRKGENSAAQAARPSLPSTRGEARWYDATEGVAHNNIQAFYQTSDGRVWVGTRGGGLSVWDGFTFHNYAAAQGLSDRISALCEDGAGNLWVGTQTSGAMKIARSGLVSYVEADGLGTPEIVSIFESLAGELLVVSAKWTINRFDGERFTSIRPNLPPSIMESSSGRWKIIQDHLGEWWVATNQGLYRFPAVKRVEDLASARPRVYTTRDGVTDNYISRIFEDARGDIWVSSFNPPEMLARWERSTGTFHRYSEKDGLPALNWANVFAEDRAGNLWIGLHNGGLIRYRAGRFEIFGLNEGVPSGLTQGLYVDRAGRLWMSVRGGGTVRVDEPDAAHPRAIPVAPEKLSGDNSWCVTEDEWGNVYIGTARGVDRFNAGTGQVKHFTTDDGLVKSEVTVSFRDRRGALWFGTREGVSRLIPELERPQPPPHVLIGGLRIAGVPYAISELGEAEVSGPELSADQNQIEVDFFGLSFSAGESLRYQYMIEGVDRYWSRPTDQRTVTASLAPGRYRFLVRAINSDGITTDKPAVFSFTILRPLWQRWWFLTLSVIAIVGILYTTYRDRVRRLIELERVRTRIATDLHDDIGASLSQIAILSEVASQRVGRTDAPVIEPLTMIADTSREMVDSMSDIVWAINPKRDKLTDLTHRMRRFASDILSARDINLRFRTPPDEREIKLGTDLRRELYLIFKESVNNLAKHSGCTTAELEFKVEGDWLIVRISDNGRGFDVDEATNGHHEGMGGHGLGSMRKRAEALGGSYEVRSRAGHGTVVTLKVPMGKHHLKLGWRKRRALPK